MLNWIWLGLVLLATLIGGFQGSLRQVAEGAFNGARYAVLDIALPLVGLLALWLGVMRLAERAGLILALARLLRPLLTRLFPEVPPTHPAMGSMILNIAANMLGLGNAATPFGLKAMGDLQRLNPRPDTATDPMCLFLAINTSAIQILPSATIIGILVAKGSANPTAFASTALLATACAATTGIVAAKLLARAPLFRLAPPPPAARRSPPPDGTPAADAAIDPPTDRDPGPASFPPLPLPARIAAWGFVAFALLALARAAHPEWFGANPSPGGSGGFADEFRRWMTAISATIIPIALAGIALAAALRRVPVFAEFAEGAKEGWNVALRILPFLVGMLAAIGMFRACGGIDLLTALLHPLLAPLGFPPELTPLCLMRPLSGSGATSLFADLVARVGPDHLFTLMGASIYGSTETTLYVATVYFGSVGIRNTRHAILAGLLADLAGIIASIAICRILFAAP